MPEPLRFSTPRPSSFPMMSVMTYLQEPNESYRLSSSLGQSKADALPKDPGKDSWARWGTGGWESSQRWDEGRGLGPSQLALKFPEGQVQPRWWSPLQPKRKSADSEAVLTKHHPCPALLWRQSRTAFGLQRDGRVPGEGTWFMTNQSWPHESTAQPNLPDDLRWSWCNNNRSAQQMQKLKHPQTIPASLVCGKISPWCQKGWVRP